MKTKRSIFFIIVFTLLLGCKSASFYPEQSIFVKEPKVVVGMSIEDFTKQYGNPYKKDFYYDKNNIFHERLYYKEQIYNKKFYTLISYFDFENSFLIKQNQESERPFDDNIYEK